ncbi:Contains similarity to a hypothetical protein gi/6983878 from Oryza Sativa BAC gb/AP001168 [Arabidopsis thaliana]|uniref:F22M8.5 protein n=1 Tax=Arabidopsis thaliana TaxID=3702 RepID=Q9LPC9_ARATH|nr:Contains similarity to a hypothetical protein gi/6983878 from Oryza Sativa BAC gb/AP001168 [Arabidopsis thaliana]
MAISEEEAKLERFLDWLQVNGGELRGCNIKYSDSLKGFGIFASTSTQASDEVLLVVPLDLAITPMRVLQDPLLGPECQKMFEQGQVDDRFLMILFLTLERLRINSSWKPYLDMLPTRFGNPLWFSDDDILELKGTNLYHATDKVSFEHFLWANSVFWSRALNIPLPHSFVFPQSQDDTGECTSTKIQAQPAPSVGSGDTIWVEGLVPGIDFCNHDLKPVATWEVDGIGSVSRVPFSMYLLSVAQRPIPKKEISISYGNKGNEELLYLYGFVIDNNPDDYLMIKEMLVNFVLTSVVTFNNGFIQVHYPVEAIPSIPFSDSKGQLLEAQLVESRQGEQPSETEVRMAVWEACGDSGALQLLVDLLNSKMMKLEENSGTEEQDARLLEEACVLESHEESRDLDGRRMSRNKWSSVVYRRGQKQLTRLLLKEAEHALHLALSSDH